MKKRISILGSTGSIGESCLQVINEKKNLFILDTFVANSNFKKICMQIKKFKPIKFVIINYSTYQKVKKKYKNNKIQILNNFNFLKNTKKKFDITVAAIPGIAGLEATIKFTKKSNKLLIANKESIICGWGLLSKIIKQKKIKVVPLDSEHFSIHQLTKNYNDNEIDKIYITASGGPFLNLKKNKFDKIKPKDAIKHPKWKMGNKISVDSSTLMNKILELMEAIKIFPFNIEKYEIIIHPQSLVHAIVKFKNGLTKLLYHEPNMAIPISNGLLDTKFDYNNFKFSQKNKINIIKNLEFIKVDPKRFPMINFVKKINIYKSTPIILNGANEILVDQFLKSKISFNSMYKFLSLVLKDKNYIKYATRSCNKLKKIYIIDTWARNTTLKIVEKGTKYK